MGLQEVLNKIAQGEDTLDFDAIIEKFTFGILAKSDTLQEAFSISSGEMEELYASGYRYYAEAKWSDAALIFRWLVVLNPFIVKYWTGYSASCQLLGEYEKALKGYAIASLLEDASPQYHFHAYECYMTLGNKVEAKKALLMALERVKKESSIKIQLEERLQALQIGG